MKRDEELDTSTDPNITDDDVKIVQTKQSRITIVEKVYHQVPGEDAIGPPQSRFYRWLDSEEQAYQRTMKIGSDWEALDLGWLKDGKHSLLVIANSLKRIPSRKPTEDERREFESRILQVGIEIGGKILQIGYIPVGEDMRISPINTHLYRIRCIGGEGKCTIFLAAA